MTKAERHQEALDRLAQIVIAAEGCPVSGCDCGSTENCVIGALIKTGSTEEQLR